MREITAVTARRQAPPAASHPASYLHYPVADCDRAKIKMTDVAADEEPEVGIDHPMEHRKMVLTIPRHSP